MLCEICNFEIMYDLRRIIYYYFNDGCFLYKHYFSLGLKLLSINCMLTTMHTKLEVLFLFKIGKVKFKILVIYVPCQTRHVIFDLVTVFANELIELVPPREWCLKQEQ